MTKTIYLTFIIWGFCLCLTIIASLFWDLGTLNDTFNQTILYKVRLPRVLEAILTGAILTLAGQMFQTVLNNPLADSFTLGLASGATFGSGLSVFLGFSFILTPIFSIGFSLITLIIVLIITAVMSRGYPIRVLIITGLMIGSLFNALLYILVLIKPNAMKQIANYFFGGFATAEMREAMYIGSVAIPVVIILFCMIPTIKLLQLGELKSRSLGLKVQRVTFIVLTLASIMTAIAVAYIGVIGFIGMIVPQLIRQRYWHYTLSVQMTLNILIGATIMLFADWIGSTIIHPVQIPASIILALIGIPTLFYILIKQKDVIS
ncbi:enterobactin ABC transporter permease [Staphylococcus devriesei]|uniref:Enterobactin ABC transporter permease n=2 Tax=Staphylococcus devriesei TaxID=586733 RepID=A0ABX5I3U4_9STAP|nr:iron ABC transporter permease [Staphylococcus devriesei]MCE5090650.1 iron ABC transporter permease [Staphylococcus devriesei]PTF14568.1 enterobactin ABC transporter permease [Staphylococcus devriesei]PTF19430.1 enterobactin ABC transporter permease [Staphylococcus devriesei]WKU12761.1 iron ABC transporter permease [Staphylococcus devriesei]